MCLEQVNKQINRFYIIPHRVEELKESIFTSTKASKSCKYYNIKALSWVRKECRREPNRIGYTEVV